jgi:hypothetical protein
MGLLAADESCADGRLALTPSARGWLLTASLTAARLPVGSHLGGLAPEVFRLSDQLFGTDFGDLTPAFGTDVTGSKHFRSDVEPAQTVRCCT